MSDPKTFPVGVPVDPAEFGIVGTDAESPTPQEPPAEPTISGESPVAAAARGYGSGATLGFFEKGAAGIDTGVAATGENPTYAQLRGRGHNPLTAAAGSAASSLLHPFLVDLGVKLSGDESLRDPSLTYEQRLAKYHAAAAESAAKYPKTTIGTELLGAVTSPINRVVGVGGKVAEATAGRVLGGTAANVAKVLAPAAEGAAIGTINASGEDADRAHGAAVGAALGMAPSVAVAAARPLARVLRSIPWIGNAPERVKAVKLAAEQQGLGIADTKAEAQRLLTGAARDPETREAVLKNEPTPEGAQRLAQHVVDLRNGLTNAITGLPGAAASKLKLQFVNVIKAIDEGNMKALREASVEAAKEVARSGLSPDQQKGLTGDIERLDAAARLGNATAHAVPHALNSFSHARVQALSGGSAIPAAMEAGAGINAKSYLAAIALGKIKAPARAADRKVAEFINAGESGETGNLQTEARNILSKNRNVANAPLYAVEKHHGASGADEEPVLGFDAMAAELKKLGASPHEIKRATGRDVK